MSFYLVAQQNEKAAAWSASGGDTKTIQMQGQAVDCEINEQGEIINDFLREYAKMTGQ